MITSIKSIDNFGVYKNFKWTEDINKFKERNIIYGWNYSGKTTLSRIFTSLRDKEIHPDFKHSDFCIVRESGEEITCKDIEETDILVQVFNSEYIQKNLKWETNEDLDGILFEIGEAGTIREQIKEKEDFIEKIKERKGLWEENIKVFNLFDKEKFSKEAREIKRNHFNNLIDFDKRHLKSIVDKITKDNYSNFIINKDSELKAIQAGARETNPGDRLEGINFIYNINEIIDEVKSALSEVPNKSKIIQILEENQDLYRWAKDGRNLHVDKELERCSFCDNPLTNERIEDLNYYYSNQSGLLLKRIEDLKKQIESFEDKLQKFNLKYSKNDFIERFQNVHHEAINKLKNYKHDYMNLLEELKGDLDKKVNEARYQNLKPSNYNIGIVEKFNTMIQEVNQNINNHNKYVDNFSEIQKDDRKKFQEHLVSSFLFKENYFKIMEKAEESDRRIKRYDRLIEKISIDIDDLKLKISSVSIGKNVFEKHIKTFLNNDKISIDITDDDKFKLMRDGKIAKNLSEGEKTAISFSYFLVTLDNLHEQQLLKEHIIFIDDPISSLDAQHIAQVYSIINSFFFRQRENPDNPEEYVSCFKQLFISTHSYEFFSFLKDSNRINKRKGKKKIKMHEYYLIKKEADGSSVIENMPTSLSNFKSEYIYLFDIIFDYYEDRDSNSNLILLPNAIRRFLEIYTLIKLPGSRDEVDGRMNQLFGGAHNLKALHHFSHFTSFDKIMKHDEIIMHLPNAVEELISILNKDEEHFLSLKQAIK